MRTCLLLLTIAMLASGCQPADRGAVAVAAPDDGGAAAREAALARSHAAPAALAVPDVEGLTPYEARQALEAVGLTLRLVVHDLTQPIVAQHPSASEPAPVDGVVELWQGAPEPELVAVEPSAAPAPAPSPSPGASASPAPSSGATESEAPPSPASGSSPPQPVAVRYVLPPHTPGRLRINPRFLPAVPAGTQLDGIASWYGPGFHGNRTACGGIYDQNGPTLATRELRCGTVVRITGPTGLTVQATVTDWGPAEWAGRRFDLSAAVFNAIAPLSRGVIGVRVVTVNVPR